MDPYARSLVRRPSRAEPDERGKEPANRRSHRGSALSGLVLVSLNFLLPRSVGPERGMTGGRAGGGVPLQCLHSAQAGKRSRIRHSKPQSKWFLYCSRAGTRWNRFQVNSFVL